MFQPRIALAVWFQLAATADAYRQWFSVEGRLFCCPIDESGLNRKEPNHDGIVVATWQDIQGGIVEAKDWFRAHVRHRKKREDTASGSRATRNGRWCRPADISKVEVWELDTFDPDDKLKVGYSQRDGYFHLPAEEDELLTIDPYVYVYHQCNVVDTNCYFRTKWKIHEEIYNGQTISRDPWYLNEDEDAELFCD